MAAACVCVFGVCEFACIVCSVGAVFFHVL